MGVIEDLANWERPVPGPRCRVGALLDDLPADEAEALLAAIDNKRMPLVAISEVLEKNGHHLGTGSIQRHRWRSTPSGCRCPR